MQAVLCLSGEQIRNLVVVISDFLEFWVCLVGLLYRLNDLDFVFSFVQVRDFTIVKDVVNVFQEGFVNDLSV